MRTLVAAPILAAMMSIDSSDAVGNGPGPRVPRFGSARKRAAALIVTCAVVGGGAFAVTEAVSGPGPSAPAATAAAGTASGPANGPTGQAAVLNGALADASFASSVAPGTSSAPGTAAGRAALRRLRRAVARLRHLGGIHGQFSFETKKGPRTVAFERGTIVSVAGADALVRAADGTTWTRVLTGTSVVREDGARAPSTALAAGQKVFAAGQVGGTTREARLIVIRAVESGSKPA